MSDTPMIDRDIEAIRRQHLLSTFSSIRVLTGTVTKNAGCSCDGDLRFVWETREADHLAHLHRAIFDAGRAYTHRALFGTQTPARCARCGEALVYQGFGEWSCPEDHA